MNDPSRNGAYLLQGGLDMPDREYYVSDSPRMAQMRDAFKTHVAKKGDTLPRIARRYGVSVTSLASANALFPKSKIARGRCTTLPMAAPARAMRITKVTTSSPRLPQKQ